MPSYQNQLGEYTGGPGGEGARHLVCLVPKRLLLEMLGKEGALPPSATPCWSLSGKQSQTLSPKHGEGWCLEAPRECWLGICSQIFLVRISCVLSQTLEEETEDTGLCVCCVLC